MKLLSCLAAQICIVLSKHTLHCTANINCVDMVLPFLTYLRFMKKFNVSKAQIFVLSRILSSICTFEWLTTSPDEILAECKGSNLPTYKLPPPPVILPCSRIRFPTGASLLLRIIFICPLT